MSTATIDATERRPAVCCHLANRLIAKSGHAPKRMALPGASEPNSGDSSRIQ